MKDNSAISSTGVDQSTRRRRRRKKTYSDATYGARLPHEDARIADEYARQHKLDRAGVVRLAMKQFAYRQQMRYQRRATWKRCGSRSSGSTSRPSPAVGRARVDATGAAANAP